ncbi:hypothetical protein AVEN_80837-1 [Araneus ventricosus]|uniref:Uncharacterized protein n=1 Tax=Araneus ventricosus TaxID=182803 RepID=A0A4Y2SZW5_ARAVE|nr:hypothetical protein AVEN_80837-1 [Araneus ventricosus]
MRTIPEGVAPLQTSTPHQREKDFPLQKRTMVQKYYVDLNIALVLLYCFENGMSLSDDDVPKRSRSSLPSSGTMDDQQPRGGTPTSESFC